MSFYEIINPSILFEFFGAFNGIESLVYFFTFDFYSFGLPYKTVSEVFPK